MAKFNDIKIGDTFYFAKSTFSTNEGPYVKLSKRTYRDEPQKFTPPYKGKSEPIVYTIGSINARTQECV